MELDLQYKKNVLTVRQPQVNKPLFIDKVDLAKADKRKKLIAALIEKAPSLDGQQDQIDTELMNLSTRANDYQKADTGQELAIDVSHIVRPHLFYSEQVCGMLTPYIQLVDNRPRGRWQLYLQWSNGERECRDLEESIALPNNKRLWFASIPPDPDPMLPCCWSQESRERWLAGYTPVLDDFLAKLQDAFDYFLHFPKEEKQGCLATLTLWTILSYVYPIWPAVPYLSIGGPAGSGKSRVFDVLRQFVHCPIISSNMTAPVLFRTLEAKGGTILVDEAERLKSKAPEAREILSILLAGYKKDQKAQRIEKAGDEFVPCEFNVYGPKAIAAINDLPPELAQRCIRITMFRSGTGSPKPSRRINTYAEWKEIRDDLHCLALSLGPAFLQLAQDPIECHGLCGRDLEIWEPLLQIAQLLGSKCDHDCLDTKLIEEYAIRITSQQKDDSVPYEDEQILQAFVRIQAMNPLGPKAKDVLDEIKQIDPAKFDNWSPHFVASRLRRYSIKSTKSTGDKRFRASDQQLEDIQSSYGMDLGIDTVNEVP